MGFSKKTANELMMLSGTLCSNPNCRRRTVGGQFQNNCGEAAHIHGLEPGTAREIEGMTRTQRQDIANGLWLCKNCHRRTDRDIEGVVYSAKLLRLWRQSAIEYAEALLEPGSVASMLYQQVVGLDRLALDMYHRQLTEIQAEKELKSKAELTLLQKSWIYVQFYKYVNSIDVEILEDDEELPEEVDLDQIDPFKPKCDLCPNKAFNLKRFIYTDETYAHFGKKYLYRYQFWLCRDCNKLDNAIVKMKLYPMVVEESASKANAAYAKEVEDRKRGYVTNQWDEIR